MLQAIGCRYEIPSTLQERLYTSVTKDHRSRRDTCRSTYTSSTLPSASRYNPLEVIHYHLVIPGRKCKPRLLLDLSARRCLSDLVFLLVLCVGYDTLHNLAVEDAILASPWNLTRTWVWLLLCDDETVISIYENPFSILSSDRQMKNIQEKTYRIRRNSLNIFQQLSKCTEHDIDVYYPPDARVAFENSQRACYSIASSMTSFVTPN